MAEPARRLDDPYDPEDADQAGNIKPGRPDSRSLSNVPTDGVRRDGSHWGKGKLKSVPNDDSKSMSPGELGGAEAAASSAGSSESSSEESQGIGSNNETFGYRNEEKGKSKSKGKSRLSAKSIASRRNLLIGGGVGGVVALIIAIFFALIPLKIEHILDNLENHFMSSSTQAVENESTSLLKGYVCTVITGKDSCLGSTRCKTTINKDCRVIVTGNGPVSDLYRTWSNNKLEQKLYNDYGIEFERTGSTLELKINGESKVYNLGPNGNQFSQVLSKSENKDLRATVLGSVENETQWNKVMIRFKLGRLLEEKYGIRRCILYCNIKKKLSIPQQQVQVIAKQFIANRVLKPTTEAEAEAIKCLISGCSATADDNKNQPCTEGKNCEENGTPESSFDESVGTDLAADQATFGTETADDLVKAADTYEGKTFTQAIVQEAVSKYLGVELSSASVDAIPILGQIIALGQTIQQLTSYVHQGSHISTDLKHISYVSHAVAAVSTYMLFRTYADEGKTGNITSGEYGNFVDALGPNGDCSSGSTCTGGTATAEEAPTYDALVNSNSATDTTTGSLFADLFSSKVSAAASDVTYSHTSGTTSDYTCNNNKPVASDAQVCPEEQFGAINGQTIVSDASGALSKLGPLVSIWNDTPLHYLISALNWSASKISVVLGPIVNFGLSVTCNKYNPDRLDPTIGAVCELKSLLPQYISKVFNDIVSYLVPSAVSNNMTGGRTFDVMAAGADASSSNFAQESLGGEKMDPQQTASLVNQQQEEQMTSFEQQSLFAKVFNVNSQYSLISRIAMDLPIGDASYITQSSIGNILSNPLGKIMNSFGSIFAKASSAFAATPASPDAWNIAQNGYPDSSSYSAPPSSSVINQLKDKNSAYYNPNYSKITDQEASSSPGAYWEKYCAAPNNPDEINQAVLNGYNDSATLDSNTGMYDNSSTDPCQLIQTTTGSTGAYFCPGMLTKDDLADSPGTTSNCASGGSQTSSNIVAREINSSDPSDSTYFKNAFVSEGENTTNSAARVFNDILSPFKEVF